MTFLDWFQTFIEEKNLNTEEWEITAADGPVHFIDTEVVIEHIKIASPAEQKQIKDIIVKIDFANGNINHFFNHLAQGIVANY